jgi:D-xylose transport system substrate-binding protein
MRKLATALLAGAALSFSLIAAAEAKGKVVGVSWSNFQEERWKTDEAAMKAAIAAAGDKYISADAQSSAQKQLTDIEGLISQGANVLIRAGAGLLRHRPGSAEGRGRRHPGSRL